MRNKKFPCRRQFLLNICATTLISHEGFVSNQRNYKLFSLQTNELDQPLHQQMEGLQGWMQLIPAFYQFLVEKTKLTKILQLNNSLSY